MLFCITKIQNYIDDNINNYIDIEFLINFNDKYDTHLLFIMPLFNYNLDPKIMYNSNKITIIYLNSFYEGNGTAFNDERIKWNEVIKIMNNNYDLHKLIALYNSGMDIHSGKMYYKLATQFLDFK